jgi:hypothetical protein
MRRVLGRSLLWGHGAFLRFLVLALPHCITLSSVTARNSEGDSMQLDESRAPDDALAGLVDAVRERLLALRGDDLADYVGSELLAVNRVLARIQAEGLSPGPLFCEWGSGLGGVCGVAALNGFAPFGIEIQHELVESARSLAKELELAMIFAEGTFLLPGDEDLTAETVHTRLAFDRHAWNELGLAPEDCDVVFAYPWPGEEACLDGVFARHASPGALLSTFHDWDHVLVQRKLADEDELQSLGWM